MQPSRYPLPATAPVPLTEKLLIAAGGWEVIRHARGLREAGRVSGATYSPPVLQGMVREGDREYKAGLKIKTPTNIENLCTCRPSREYGTICAHSVAVGVAILAGMNPPAPTPSAPVAASKPGAPAKPVPVALPFQADPSAAARLHVVLAPDLAAAWAKGQLLVGLELSTGGSRTMFNAPGTPRTLLPEDLRVVERVAAATNTVPGGMSFVDRAAFLDLLGALVGHPRLTLGRSGTLKVSAGPCKPALRAKFLPDGSLDLAVQWPDEARAFVAGQCAWLLRTGSGGTSLQPVSPGLPTPYFPLLEESSRRLPPEQAEAFMDGEWPRLGPFFDLRSDDHAIARKTVEDPEPAPPTFILSLEGSLNQLGAQLQTDYGKGWLEHASSEPERRMVGIGLHGPSRVIRTRHVGAERAALARLKQAGFEGPNSTHQYYLKGEDRVLRFVARELPALQADPGWKVTLGARFTNVSQRIEFITPEIASPRSGADWFELEMNFTSRTGERYPAAEIQRLLQMGTGHARLRNGKRAILPEELLNDFQEVLRDCDPSQPQPGVYRLDRSKSAYLEATFERWNVAAAPTWNDYLQRQGKIQRAAEPTLTPALTAALRAYQRDGVRWLALLAANALGGILADEMGLGKTLQALAYLSASKTAAASSASASGLLPSTFYLLPSLVVCPTSLVDNWQREAARFTPELRTLAIDGPDRAALFAQVSSHDLVVTSYALLRRDLDKYRQTEFAAVILDEAHHIKNPDSQVAKAACELRSRHRFVLTGTPMENSVRDLWSIMRFALPGYLGNRQDFRERYELPLSRPGDPAADGVRERLTRRLRPVLLRRRKKDVATELPDRIEQTAFCDLTPAQTEVYRGLLEQSRLKLDHARRDKNQGAGRMLVLTALLRLRQACCDLRLLGLQPDAAASSTDLADEGDEEPTTSSNRPVRPAAVSAKLTLLDELLTEIREGGHRVLIFSQFVSMLKILSAHLEGQGTTFCYLDGSTKPRERTAQVERFQSDASITAFLISVKAGGVGLNLTGADTVIHFDPWWNPAVEAQATDRAHRIGQTRVVTAYRLIARGTVEEKIFALQNRKKELTASLVEREKDEPLLETLSFEEIESLLE